ncbi:MotE family protein [Brevirhabdus sp.]|uniref:MotE family protein n=1 Tax=Brevirhabdus sp. TaxID=2004514 RepID=UPI004059DE78
MRPFPLIVAALVVAGGAKIGVSLMNDSAAQDLLFGRAEAAAPAPAPAPAPAATPAVQQCEAAPEEMLQSIRAERDLVAAQKEKLATRAAELDLMAETLSVERKRLSDLKGELETLLQRVAQAQTADVDRLVALYRNMKPKQAAAIMNDLDLEVTVMVLGTMAERDAAPIMAALDPIRARAISQIILERSKLPGDQRLDDIKL